MGPAFVDEQGKPISVYIARAPGSNAPLVPFTTASGIGLSMAEYPSGAIPFNISSGNVAAGVAAATLPAAPGKTTYVTGFEITAGGATIGVLVSPTLTGVSGGTLTYTYAAIAGALLLSQPLIVQFAKALPASAVNTAITLSMPSLGTGNTNAAVNIHGYQL